MTRYVISDHHFGHENIIEYTDRGFLDVNDMNTVMQNRWEETVGEDDAVIYGGDISLTPREETIDRVTSLPGSFMLIAGNHDSFSAETVPFPVVEHAILQHDGYRFWYTHRPENVPDDWTQWILHGHTHNNDPFINYDTHHINVSVEGLKYTPLPLPQLTKALNQMRNGDVARTIKESPIAHHQWYQELTPI